MTEAQDVLERNEAEREALEGRIEETLQEDASEQRRRKGQQLATRKRENLDRRRVRDESGDVPEAPTTSRKVRTGFALLKCQTPSAFERYVSAVVELIEDYDGDVTSLTYNRERANNFAALVYSMPANLYDVLPTAIALLRRELGAES